MKFLVLFCSLIGFVLVQAQNYCASKYCSKGEKHIACNNANNFYESCPKDARMIDISPYKNIILQSHNEKRNLIAGGGLPGYLPAQRMATMQWDDELSRLAGMNVKQCAMKHDKCRNTDKFKSSGQNLGWYGYYGFEMNDETLIKNRIDAWWIEYKDCKMAYINSYPRSYSGPQIGHFTVMTAEKNIRVGCAASRYFDGKFKKFLFACNYATTNILGKPLYVAGRTASACKTNTNPSYRNLCSVSEVYSDL